MQSRARFLFAMIAEKDRPQVESLIKGPRAQAGEGPAATSERFNGAERAEPLADNAPHLLVVDDDQKIRALLGRFLTSNGFRVTEAADAAAARSFMRGLAFDLVLLDVMMPGECGLTLAARPQIDAPCPICMLTALADAEDRI